MDYVPNYPLAIPDRAQPLIQSPAITCEQWQLVRNAVRPELLTPYFDRAQRALASNLPDAAINYVWNVLEEDLRQRIMSYGVEYFASSISKPNLRTLDDLREDVKSIELLDGCFTLGLINDEALFQLQHCRELRNKFSAAHYPMSEPDPLETANFIKNCVKYALCHDLPAAGFSIKAYMEHLDAPNVDYNEAYEFLKGQSSRIYGPLINRLFEDWMKADSSSQLRLSIKKIAPLLWDLCSESIRSNLAMRYTSLKDRPKPDDAELAKEFLILVRGLTYVPENIQVAIFKRFAQNLLDAYDGSNNYYNEPTHAKSLLSLGNQVPSQVAFLYAKSVLLSYVGNYYGHAWNAESYDLTMLQQATPTVMIALQNVLSRDSTVAVVLCNSKPASRFSKLVPELLPKVTDSKTRSFLEDCASGSQTVMHRMRSTLQSIQQSNNAG